MNINPVRTQTSFGIRPLHLPKPSLNKQHLTVSPFNRTGQDLANNIWRDVTESPFAGEVLAKVGDGGGSPERLQFLMMQAIKGP